MSGNGYGTYRVTLSAQMAAYDACPPLLRHAQAYAVADFASPPILDAYHEAMAVLRNHRQVCQAIIRDMHDTELDDTRRAYGPDHPETCRDRA